jgi:hypothetical protein
MKREFILFHNGGIGDFLMFVFLAQQIWAGGQASRIVIVVPRAGAFLRGLVGRYAYLSVVETSLRAPGGLLGLLAGAARKKTVLIHPTLGSIPLHLKLVAWLLTRAPGSTLVGFQDAGVGCRLLYSQVLRYDTDKNYADLMRDTASRVGGVVDPRPPRLDLLEPQNTPSVPRPYVVFHPGAGISGRKRSFEEADASAVVRFLLSKGVRVVVSGGPEERHLVETAVHAAGDGAVSLIGASPLELGALIKGARLYIGGDTGITHLACFLGTTVLEVAHNATAHWLCFYHPGATVLYRLAGEEETRTEQEYLQAHARGVLRPFAYVPAEAVRDTIERELRP